MTASSALLNDRARSANRLITLAAIVATLTTLTAPMSFAAPDPGSLTNWSYGTGRSIGSIGDGEDRAYAGIVQGNGKVVLAGACNRDGLLPGFPGGAINCLLRYSPDGSLYDPTFVGRNPLTGGPFTGKFAKSDFGAGTSRISSIVATPAPGTDSAQADPFLTVIGSYNEIGSAFPFDETRLSINLLNPNGTLNDERGYRLDDGPSSRIYSVIQCADTFRINSATQFGGKIVSAFACRPAGSNDESENRICLTRLKAGSAALDGTFPAAPEPGGDTIPVSRNPGFAVVGPYTNRQRIISINSMRVFSTPPDDLVAVGRCRIDLLYVGCITRFLSNGEVFRSFGKGTPGIRSIREMTEAYDAVRFSETAENEYERYVVLGRCLDPNTAQSVFCFSALRGYGAPDSTWGVDGQRLINNLPWPILSAANPPRLLKQIDGKMVLAYGCRVGSIASFVCLARYMSDGTPDTSFKGPGGSTTGAFFLPLSADTFRDVFADFTIDSDQNFLVTGSCAYGQNSIKFCAARLNGGTYNLDILGLGNVFTTWGDSDFRAKSPGQTQGLTRVLAPSGAIRDAGI
jgi:hypothetical protein